MSDLPKFIRCATAARLARLPVERLRAMADRGEFARRYILDGLDFFKESEFLDAIEKVTGAPKQLRDDLDWLAWQASGRVAGRLLRSLEGRPVVAPAVDPQHGTEAAPVSPNVAREPGAVGFHVGRVPTMGADKQENAAGSPNVGVLQQCGTGGGTRCSKGAIEPGGSAQCECERSPADVAGEAGFWPEGAKKGPSPRTSWGLTEAELMRGYCRTGCTVPPSVLVEGEAICCACADAMGAA